jgi:hypothetical protein
MNGIFHKPFHGQKRNAGNNPWDPDVDKGGDSLEFGLGPVDNSVHNVDMLLSIIF